MEENTSYRWKETNLQEEEQIYEWQALDPIQLYGLIHIDFHVTPVVEDET